MQRYGTLCERGYTFEAFTPTKNDDPIAFNLRILVGGQVKYSLLIPMLYPPAFGVDVGDASQLEAVVDQVLELLPPPGQFDAAVIAALDLLEASLGGTALRNDHASEKRSDSGRVGHLEYVEGLFAQSFACLLGGREAIDKWLGTKQQELGWRTPAEALHLGMVPEVLKLLQTQTGIDHEHAE